MRLRQPAASKLDGEGHRGSVCWRRLLKQNLVNDGAVHMVDRLTLVYVLGLGNSN